MKENKPETSRQPAVILDGGQSWRRSSSCRVVESELEVLTTDMWKTNQRPAGSRQSFEMEARFGGGLRPNIRKRTGEVLRKDIWETNQRPAGSR